MGLKTKMVMAVATSVAGAAMIAGGTFAEFSSQAATQNNTFSSGTLQLELNPGNGWGGAGNNVTATWKSPSNWAPGQTTTGTLSMRDDGTIDAKHVYFSFSNVKDTSPYSLLSEIDVNNITMDVNGTSTPVDVGALAQSIGVPAGQPLTLQEFVSHEYVAWDSPNDILQANQGNVFDFTMGLTFNDTADNNYQGLTSSFDVNLNATQNSPTDGYVDLMKYVAPSGS